MVVNFTISVLKSYEGSAPRHPRSDKIDFNLGVVTFLDL